MILVKDRLWGTYLLFTFSPILLALSFAVIWFFPYHEQMIGWGDDPYFNLWTLEHVWKQLSTLGISHIFSSSFWETPIFYPMTNTLAFSENQIVLGILSWPIRILSGNGTFTLNLCAMAMSLATFFFSWKWFRSLGIQKYAFWGALLFQACGWIQDHYAHYQNICIFLFPLALCSWRYFLELPNFFRTLFCALSFGTALGWNVYYQVFLNSILCFLLLYSLFHFKSKRPWLILLICLTFLIELPFALKYFEVERSLGSMKVPSGEYAQNSASWASLFAHSNHNSFLQRVLPFYPNTHLPIESVGFLGFSWLLLWILSTQQPKARLFAVVAFLIYWISLGPQFGLMNLMKLMPGFHGLRAVGRIQVLVAFFSLTGILIFLENQNRRWPVFLLAMVALEVFPGELPKYVQVSKSIFTEPTTENTPFERQIAHISKNEPWLVASGLTAQFQLSMLRAGNKFYEGYSGRIPLNAHLLQLLGRDKIGSESLKTQLIFSEAKHLLSLDDALSSSLATLSFLKSEGCFAHHDFHVCIFSPHWSQKEDLERVRQPRLSLAQDTHWIYPPQPLGHKGVLRANRQGILDYNGTGKCWIEDSITFANFIPFTTRRPLLAHGFEKVEFQAEEQMVERESKQWIFSFPLAIRPKKTYRIICAK